MEAGSLLKQQQPSRAGLFHSKPAFPTQKTHVLVQNKGQAPRQALRGKQSYLGSPSLIWLTFGLYRLIHPGEMLPQLAFLFISTNWGFGRECSVQNVLFIPKSLRSSLTEIPCYLMCRQPDAVSANWSSKLPPHCPLPHRRLSGQEGLGRSEEVQGSELQMAPNKEVSRPQTENLLPDENFNLYPSDFYLFHNHWRGYTQRKCTATEIR